MSEPVSLHHTFRTRLDSASAKDTTDAINLVPCNNLPAVGELLSPRGGEMATMYAESELAVRNDEDIARHAHKHSMLSKESLKELNTKRATVRHTVTGWWKCHCQLEAACHPILNRISY